VDVPNYALGRDTPMEIEAERGFLGLVAVGDEATEQMYQEVCWTAVARVFDLAAIRKLIEDRLDVRV
jgi:hypothetical protein